MAYYIRRIGFLAYIVLVFVVPFWLIISASSIDYTTVNKLDMDFWAVLAILIYGIFALKKVFAWISKMERGSIRFGLEALHAVGFVYLVSAVFRFLETAFDGGSSVFFNIMWYVIAGFLCRILDWEFNKTIIENRAIDKQAHKQVKLEKRVAEIRHEVGL